MTLIDGLVGKLLLVVLGLGVLGVGFLRCQELAAERDAARAAVTQDQAAIDGLRQANTQNLAALARLKADYDRAVAAQAAADADAQQRGQQLSQTERMIAHAPKTDRGRVPPVVLHAVDGLLQRPAAGPGAGDEDRRGAAAGAAGAP
jgi:uncharacterized protein HemX